MSNADIVAEVRAWLEENWDPTQSLVEWRDKLADSGWGAPDWPTEYYGRGLNAEQAALVEAEFTRIGAVGTARSGPRLLAAVTLLAHGSPEQKKRYLRGIITGADAWCQLFSEPGSGSDLAGATTRADRDGDRWVVNGQKVWNTSAHHADYGLLVARTDWDVPKHQGLSYFILNMHQAGIEVRQLKQMNGHASFNEVFFTDAMVEPADLIGEEGQGWAVALTTLAHERSSFSRMRGGEQLAKEGRIYEEYAEEVRVANEPYKWYPQRAGRVDLIVDRAEETAAIVDPVIRQDIAALLALSKCAEWYAARGRARPSSIPAAGSINKLAASRIAQASARVHTAISGTEAMLEGEQSARDGIIAEILLSTPATSIAGGTDEIQKNIIAERILEMPKEPRFDGGPFKDVRRNA